jgi:DNA-binding transcriptional ArsR family regulator
MAYRGYDVFMPPKNIASVLNNESNLRILEKLKVRPHYPRELAAEMGVSEPFVVRRLKAMEEHDIVEGRWETEGSRKVKRYYVKDVTLQLGKDGLKVTTAEAPARQDINIFKELAGTITRLPLLLILIFGVLLNIWYLVAIVAVLFLWNAAIDYAFYKNFRLKTPLLSMIVNLAVALLLVGIITISDVPQVPAEITAIAMVIGMAVLVLVIVYRSRFYQLEYSELIEDMVGLMARLEDAPVYVKAFYLPTAIRWKINEYFGLV